MQSSQHLINGENGPPLLTLYRYLPNLTLVTLLCSRRVLSAAQRLRKCPAISYYPVQQTIVVSCDVTWSRGSVRKRHQEVVEYQHVHLFSDTQSSSSFDEIRT